MASCLVLPLIEENTSWQKEENLSVYVIGTEQGIDPPSLRDA